MCSLFVLFASVYHWTRAAVLTTSYFVYRAFRKIKWSIHTSWMNPVGIFQRPRVAGEQCFSCTTSTFTNLLEEISACILTEEILWKKCSQILNNSLQSFCRISLSCYVSASYWQKKETILHCFDWWQILRFRLDVMHLLEACKVLQESSKLTSHILALHGGIENLPETKMSLVTS